MTRLIVTLGLLLGFGSASAQPAEQDDDYGRAGRKGTVTAYELDGKTVIGHRTCLSSGRHSWKYVECGSRLRDRMKTKLCAKLGSGTHWYMYQIGDNRPTKTSVYCRR